MSDPATPAVAIVPVADEPAVLASDIRNIMARYEHDIIGKAHFVWEELKALLAEAEGLV